MAKTAFSNALAASLLLLVQQLLLPVAAATNFVRTSGTKILDENGDELFFSGINLGNWLVWEGYLMMGDFNYRTHTQFFNDLSGALGGVDKASEFEYQWRLNYVDEQAIVDLSNLGFNSVRVPFNYKLFYQNGQIVNDGFEFFDRVIAWCRTHGLYVLLDMHGAPGYQNPGDHADNVDSNANQPRDTVKFWDGGNVQLAASIWRHIASYYADEPVIWGYDLINEPVPQAGREYELLPSFVTMRNAIREVDNNHIIVAEGSWWGSDLTKIDWKDSQVQSQTGITQQWDDKLVYQIHHYGPASGTYGREQITNNLNIPLFIGEYGETDEGNLQAITDWAKQTLEGYFPWSFKKMSHDRTLWTIPPNAAYNQVKSYINNGGSPPTHLYNDMISFAQINVRNGHSSHEWHQGFYNAIKPSITCSEAASFAVPGQIQAEDYCSHQGVQLETTTDSGGGLNIGFLDTGDYTEYNIDVASSGLYTFAIRVASQYLTGQMVVKVDGTSLDTLNIPNTGGWQSFTTISTTFSLAAGPHRLRLEFPSGGFNMNWMDFTAASGNVPTSPPTVLPQTGCGSAASFVVPGLIQAEEYCQEYGVQHEANSDSGGGQHIGFLDSGDFTEYNIDVSTSGQYTLDVRVASDWSDGQMDVKIDGSSLASFAIPNTGGWQSFTTMSTTLSLAAGQHRLRLDFPGGGFNLNWLSFSTISGSVPTTSPTRSPIVVVSPTNTPTRTPTDSPSKEPTKLPTASPSKDPTKAPSLVKSPTPQPTNPPVPPTPPADCNSAASFIIPGYLVSNQFCGQQGVEILPNTLGGTDIAQIDNGDYVEYNIQVAASSQYTFAAHVKSPTYSGQINLQLNNVPALWLSVPHTNGVYKTISANLWLNAGNYRLRVAFPQGGFKVNWMGFASGSNNPPPPPVSSTGAPTMSSTSFTALPTKAPTNAPTRAPISTPPTASSTDAITSSPTQCNVSGDCDDFDECTIDICTGGLTCLHQNGACESMGKICDGSGKCVFPPTSAPTKSPTLHPTKSPVQPTGNPPAADCSSASGFGVPGFIGADQYCNQQGVTLQTTTDVGGGYDIAQIDNGDFVEYNIVVSANSQYTFAARVESATYSGQINLLVDGISVLWLPVQHTNGAYQTKRANVWLSAGTHKLRVAFPQGGFKVSWFDFKTGANNMS